MLNSICLIINMTLIILKLILWLAIWFLIWLIFYFLTNKKMNYIEKYRLTIFFFAFISLLIIIFFYKDLSYIIEPSFQLLPFILLILLFIYYKKIFEQKDILFSAKFYSKYLLAKSFEILYQQ